ncbi:hypothetical protein ACHAW6_000599 [Cyclotella cf. meneghiniana]
MEQFPMQLQSGNKYIMVMVNIDSSGILLVPIRCAYDILLLQLQQAGIQPKKHILDNKISPAMKKIITENYKNEGYQMIFYKNYGTNCYHKLKSLSIYFNNPMQHPQSLYMHT